MEINAKEWINDLERQGNNTVTKLAVLEHKVASNHAAVMANSDARLATIMGGINDIREDTKQQREEIVAVRRRILVFATTVFTSVLTAAWFVIVEPMSERIAVLERRVLDVEERSLRVSNITDSK